MKNILNITGHDLLLPNILKTEGCYIYDDKGKKYLDLESGVWCTSIGHNHERFRNIISKQLNGITHAGFCYSSEIVDLAAENVLSITGMHNGKCVFLCSGSEAIELARQIAKVLAGKSISMTLHDSYLGSYSSVVNRGDGWFRLDWKQCQKCPKSETCDIDCPLIRDIPDNISEFLFEPGSAGGFVRFPPKAMIENIVGIVRNYGGKIIINEVTTGIGRTGKWFGYNYYNIQPDMVAIGKGIGNGYPVSVTSMSESIVSELSKTDYHYSQSHQNDPLGAAIANEVLNIIKEEKLLAKAMENGEFLKNELEKIVDGKMITEVRGRGMMWAIDIPDEKICKEVYLKLLEKGIIVSFRRRALRIDPPLIIAQPDIEDFIQKLKAIIMTFHR
ncbi:MAG: aspartate aminotransferase family protein [Candidatus Marinimicrobia bacterium]|nr:aspartate aminotransferase family protein [Candidatus Neomarinimicrobiota bacterium]